MPDALEKLRNLNVNLGTLFFFVGGFGAVFAASFGILVGLDSRIDARLDARVSPLEHRIADMQKTLRENEGRRNAQYGHIINKLDEMQQAGR